MLREVFTLRKQCYRLKSKISLPKIHAKLQIFIYLKQGRRANFRAVTLQRPNERILKTFSSIGGAAFIMLKIVK